MITTQQVGIVNAATGEPLSAEDLKTFKGQIYAETRYVSPAQAYDGTDPRYAGFPEFLKATVVNCVLSKE